MVGTWVLLVETLYVWITVQCMSCRSRSMSDTLFRAD